MSRAWITGLTMAGVVGTGGAALAGLGAGSDQGVAPDAQPASAAGRVAVNPSTTTSTTTYQVGAAGSVTIVKAGDSLTVSGSAADAGWVVGSATSSGGHAEVQFTDNLQVVTFSADLVDDQVVVSLSNAAGPGAPTTEVTPMAVTIITAPPAAPVTNSYKPRPATPATPAPTTQPRPAPTTPPPPVTAPAPTTQAPPVAAPVAAPVAPEAPPAPTTQAPPAAPPAPSATTAPSGAGDEEEDHDEADHENENDDHHQDAGNEDGDHDNHEEPGDD